MEMISPSFRDSRSEDPESSCDISGNSRFPGNSGTASRRTGKAQRTRQGLMGLQDNTPAD